MSIAPIAPCLCFDPEAEHAANFYVSVLPNSRIGAIGRYAEAGRDMHGRPACSVMTVAFELNGQPVSASPA